jgi:hypothetical protein
MGRVYAVTYNGTLTAAGGNADLLSIQPADDKPCRLLGFLLSQTSEVGDAAEENIRITAQYFPATFTVGSGGSAITATKPPNDPANGPAWGFTARCNDSTVATTSGTASTFLDVGWNERNTPWEYMFPDSRFSTLAVQGTAIVVRCESTVADDVTISVTFWIEEEG